MSPLDASDHGAAERPLADLLADAAFVVAQGFAEVLRRRGASLPVWRALAALAARPGETVTGLAEACLLQQPTMTKLLDRMVRDGLVARAPDPRDRRVVRLALTPEGAGKAAELAAAAERHEAEVLARHPQAEGIKPVLRDIAARAGPAPRPGAGGEGGLGEGGAQGEGNT
jgi:DNA-binding MarR family transcriptional regulator